jgi:hypothetical protein
VIKLNRNHYIAGTSVSFGIYSPMKRFKEANVEQNKADSKETENVLCRTAI